MDETTAKLPEITCNVCEAFLDRLGEEAADIQQAAAGQALELGKLVFRLYSQTEDPAISSRCLDIIDQMAERETYGVEDLLAFDRKQAV